MLSWCSVPILGSKLLSSCCVKSIMNYLREMLLSKPFESACTYKQTFPVIAWIKQKNYTWLQSACVLCILSGVQSSEYLCVIKSKSSHDEVGVIGSAMFSSLFFNNLAQFQAQWFSGPSVGSPNATIINKTRKTVLPIDHFSLMLPSNIILTLCFL